MCFTYVSHGEGPLGPNPKKIYRHWVVGETQFDMTNTSAHNASVKVPEYSIFSLGSDGWKDRGLRVHNLEFKAEMKDDGVYFLASRPGKLFENQATSHLGQFSTDYSAEIIDEVDLDKGAVLIYSFFCADYSKKRK